MGNKDKSNKRRYRKKKSFCGNRFSKSSICSSTPDTDKYVNADNRALPIIEEHMSLSAKKLKLHSSISETGNEELKSLIGDRKNVDAGPVNNDDDDRSDSAADKVFDRSSFYEQRDSAYYLLLDSDIFENIIEILGRCPKQNCHGHIEFRNNFQNKHGLSCQLEFSCAECEWSRTF